jgi:hypothetical protein
MGRTMAPFSQGGAAISQKPPMHESAESQQSDACEQ